MVSSPNYDRLKALNNFDQLSLQASEDIRRADSRRLTPVRQCTDAVKDTGRMRLIQDVSVGQSETKLGADQWMNSFSTDTSKRMDLIKATKERHEKLRAEMARLYEDGGKISDQLVSEVDASEKRNSTVTLVTDPIRKVAVEVDVGLYLVQLAEQRNQKREDESKRILDGLNAAGQDHADKIHEPVEKPDPDPDPVPDPDPQPNPRQRKRPWPPTPAGRRGRWRRCRRCWQWCFERWLCHGAFVGYHRVESSGGWGTRKPLEPDYGSVAALTHRPHHHSR